jgi:ribose 5-phosphate isomerase B
MKIAVVSDQIYPVHRFVIDWLKNQGHEVVLFGALKTGQDESWVAISQEAAKAVANGQCQEGIFFCWTGTGISMTANKIPGIRAALCTDAETTRGARIWNHANVLCLSNRLLSQDVAQEILDAWFSDYDKVKGAKGVEELKTLEQSLARNPS